MDNRIEPTLPSTTQYWRNYRARLKNSKRPLIFFTAIIPVLLIIAFSVPAFINDLILQFNPVGFLTVVGSSALVYLPWILLIMVILGIAYAIYRAIILLTPQPLAQVAATLILWLPYILLHIHYMTSPDRYPSILQPAGAFLILATITTLIFDLPRTFRRRKDAQVSEDR